jgi:hypothetical protein
LIIAVSGNEAQGEEPPDGGLDDEQIQDEEKCFRLNPRILNQCALLIGFFAMQEDQNTTNLLFTYLPECIKLILEIIDFQLGEYFELRNQINKNTTATNEQIINAIGQRESFIKESLWAISNITACHEQILEKFFFLDEQFGSGMCAFDKCV